MFGAAAFFDLDRKAGKIGLQGGQDPRHQAMGQGGDGGNAQQAVLAAAQFHGEFLQMREAVEGGFNFQQKRAPAFGDGEAFELAFEQRKTELLLQCRDETADRGLREADTFGGACDPAITPDGQSRAQLADVGEFGKPAGYFLGIAKY